MPAPRITERRPATLLGFAIAASAAVVPVMLGMLLLVAVVRPADPALAAAGRGAADRYVSVRHVAALQTFEQAVGVRAASAAAPINAAAVLAGVPACRGEWAGARGVLPWLARAVGRGEAGPTPAERVAAQLAALDAALLRFSERANPRVADPVGIDSARWFAAATRSLATPIESAVSAGPRFQVRCADLLAALAALARADARMLDALAWRGTEGSVALARWRPGQQVQISARQVMRNDPWGGVAGCIYLGRTEAAGGAPTHYVAGVRSAQRHLCGRPDRVALAALPGGGAAAGPGVAPGGGAAAGPGVAPGGGAGAGPGVAPGGGAAPGPSTSSAGDAAPGPGAGAAPRVGSAPGAGSAAPAAATPLVALDGEPGLADALDDTRWMVPPSLHTLLQPLESLRQPSGALYRRLADAAKDAANEAARDAAAGAANDAEAGAANGAAAGGLARSTAARLPPGSGPGAVARAWGDAGIEGAAAAGARIHSAGLTLGRAFGVGQALADSAAVPRSAAGPASADEAASAAVTGSVIDPNSAAVAGSGVYSGSKAVAASVAGAAVAAVTGSAPARSAAPGVAIEVGIDLFLTIDPALQALAQKTAACYTGRHEVCRSLGMRRNEDRAQGQGAGANVRARSGAPAADGPTAEPALGAALLEGAMVRMAAVAVIDVASGRIEALAGAMSRCARQEVDGPGRDARCDTRLPYPVQYRSDALLNPAVFHDAMPASTVKPILAAAFLADLQAGARWLAAEKAEMKRVAAPAPLSLRGQLMRSDSARFLDRMFCSETGFARCLRPWNVQAWAPAFGWNAGCAAAGTTARDECGRHDLLFGRNVAAPPVPVPVPVPGRLATPSLPPGRLATPALASGVGISSAPTPGVSAMAAPTPGVGATPGALPALASSVAYGRLMSEPLGPRIGAPMRLRPPAALDAGVVQRCAAGADGRRHSDDDWERCRGGAVVDVVAEGWGQGHARASALGVAGMMATLAAAANGQNEVVRPHLVDALRAGARHGAVFDTALQHLAVPAREPLGLAPDAASVILSGLSYSHRAGTARSACEQVFDARRCRAIDWLAGKTGTPSFPSDGVALDELARLCRPANAAAAAALVGAGVAGAGVAGAGVGGAGVGGAALVVPAAPPRLAACSSLHPYKWYVAAYRADGAGSGPWTKAIAVLTERNWLRRSGHVHGAGDHGPNPSAEIAMQIAGRRVGWLGPGAAP